MVVAAVAAPAVSWPDGAGRAEDGSIIAEATVVNLGARGEIATGLPFLDHMIDQLTSHCQLGVSVVVTKDGTPLARALRGRQRRRRRGRRRRRRRRPRPRPQGPPRPRRRRRRRRRRPLLRRARGTFAAPSTRRTPRATSTSSPPTRPSPSTSPPTAPARAARASARIRPNSPNPSGRR